MPEPNKYIYEIKCMGCGCVAELTVIAGPDYLDSHGSEWLEPQRAALERIGWILHRLHRHLYARERRSRWPSGVPTFVPLLGAGPYHSGSS